MKSASTLTNLVDDVEELIVALGDAQSPQIQELRDRVNEAIGSTKRAIAQPSKKTSARIGQYAGSLNAYIGDYPRLAFMTGALLFGTLGYLAGATSTPRK